MPRDYHGRHDSYDDRRDRERHGRGGDNDRQRGDDDRRGCGRRRDVSSSRSDSRDRVRGHERRRSDGRGRSRSRERVVYRKSARSRSLERDRSLSRERDRGRSRGRSNSRERDHSRSRERDRGRGRGRSNSRERSRERIGRGGDNQHRNSDRERQREPERERPAAAKPNGDAQDDKEQRRRRLETWKAEKAAAGQLPVAAAPTPAAAPSEAAGAVDPIAERKRRLAAWKAEQPEQCGSAAAASAAAPSAVAGATVASVFKKGEDDEEDERKEEELAERRRKLQAMQLEMEREKVIEALGAQQVATHATAAAAEEEEEEDALDVFMREHVEKAAKEEEEKAARHELAWQAQYGDKDVQVSDVIEEEKNMNLHCFVCKRWGHTKRDCPHKKCNFCHKEGHIKEDCPELDNKIEKQFDDEKKRKRAKQYAAKKAKRAQEWESHLRSKTGVDGFQVLYEILGLPKRRLATKEQIRRAYRLQSLRYHPDKVPDEEVEEAKEKFLAVQTAYELLLEGMETGGEGMGGAVFSGGDLQYAGGPAGAPTTAQAGASSAAENDGTVEAAPISDAEAGVGETLPSASADGGLSSEELAILMQEESVQRALEEIGADPEAVAKYEHDPVVMGVIHALSAAQ